MKISIRNAEDEYRQAGFSPENVWPDKERPFKTP